MITRRQQSIVFNDLPEKAEGDQPFTITATASSGLPVTFTSSDESLAAVVNNTVTISGVGTVVITAQQDGNERFDPATPVSRDLVVREIGPLRAQPVFAGRQRGERYLYRACCRRGRDPAGHLQQPGPGSIPHNRYRHRYPYRCWNGRKEMRSNPGVYAWSLQGHWTNGDPISFQGNNHGQVVLLR